MKRQVMKPFRAPRSAVRAVQRQIILESQAVDASPQKANVEVMAVSGKASEPRRSPRTTGTQDTEVRPQPTLQLVEEEALDSEGPTEFRGVWERLVPKDLHDLARDTLSSNIELTTRGSNMVGVQITNAVSPIEGGSPCLSEFESPGYLSRRKANSKLALAQKGHSERAKPLTKTVKKQAPRSIGPLQKTMLKRKAPSSSDSEDDNFPIVATIVSNKEVALADVTTRPPTLSEGKRHVDSDCEDDNVPLVSLLVQDIVHSLEEVSAAIPVRRSARSINTLIAQSQHDDNNSDDDNVPITTTLTKPLDKNPTTVIPRGIKAIGLIVARDFGVDGGIYHGKITSVDFEGRRVHYHVRYDDGDEEDFDYDEMLFAVELAQAVALGKYLPSKETDASGMIVKKGRRSELKILSRHTLTITFYFCQVAQAMTVLTNLRCLKSVLQKRMISARLKKQKKMY
jgi:hypothetical protein